MTTPRYQLLLLATIELLAMSVWFSASALVPQLQAEWGLSPAGAAWLTMSVQLGFVVGAVGSALANLPDRWLAPRVIALGALLAAGANALIPTLAAGVGSALALRFATGMFLAMVYPPGMKVVASWARRDRGLWIGVMVGALTVGSASPHLLAGLAGALPPWRMVMWATSSLAVASSLMAVGLPRLGPHVATSAPFDVKQALAGLMFRPTRLANLGYFGHMWELYAVWAWLPVLLLASYEEAGWGAQAGRLAAFAVIAVGGVSSVLAGKWADRLGRTRVTSGALVISGACCLTVGYLGAHPGWLTALSLLWGLAVIADSAQFSAAVSELADERYVGTALLVQTSIGFLLTLATLQLVPLVAGAWGWGPGFSVLAMGPALGVWSMLRLRTLPESERMASGNR